MYDCVRRSTHWFFPHRCPKKYLLTLSLNFVIFFQIEREREKNFLKIFFSKFFEELPKICLKHPKIFLNCQWNFTKKLFAEILQKNILYKIKICGACSQMHPSYFFSFFFFEMLFLGKNFTHFSYAIGSTLFSRYRLIIFQH